MEVARFLCPIQARESSEMNDFVNSVNYTYTWSNTYLNFNFKVEIHPKCKMDVLRIDKIAADTFVIKMI